MARQRLSLTAVLLTVCLATAAHAFQEIRLRIGTVVPSGSLWHDTLQYIAQDWQRIVGPAEGGDSPGQSARRRVRHGAEGARRIIDAVGLSSVGSLAD
jgi:hypothetical protein